MKSEPENATCSHESPHRALAIGPSGPAWFPPTKSEAATRASAINFNPNHNALGQFTTADDAASHKPRSLTENDTIRGRDFGSPNNATCSATGLQTLVATGKKLSKAEAPKLEEIQAKVEAAAAQRNAETKAAIEKYNASVKDSAKKLQMRPVTINWADHGVGGPSGEYAAVMQQVLSQYGVKSTYKLGYDEKKRMSLQELTDTLIAKGTPAMLNVGESFSN